MERKTKVEKTGSVCRNEFCSVEYKPDEKEISGRDLTDRYNDPAFYTKSKRNLSRAWADIQESFNEDTKFWDVLECCSKNGVRVHTWCMVD